MPKTHTPVQKQKAKKSKNKKAKNKKNKKKRPRKTETPHQAVNTDKIEKMTPLNARTDLYKKIK